VSIKEIGEFGFIKKISRGCVVRPDDIIRPIGDDAAAFRTNPEELTLVTTDLLVEHIHFSRKTISGFNLGHKSLAVNLSDIAAMGGTAKEAFVSIAVPEDCPVDYLEDLYRGIKKLASEFDVNILGGDTTASKSDLMISITVTGSVPEQEMLRRDKAQPGDSIFSTGYTGESKAGLHILLNSIPAATEEFQSLLNAHMLPKPFLAEGRFLAQQKGVHSAIDVSDGLSADLMHIAEESNTGARLYYDGIPVSENLKKFCAQFNFDPVEYALTGGEDYILLCTVPPDDAENIALDYQKKFKQPLHKIGEITDLKKLEMVYSGDRVESLTPQGWDHFKSNIL